jgi:hypothetical protein
MCVAYSGVIRKFISKQQTAATPDEQNKAKAPHLRGPAFSS